MPGLSILRAFSGPPPLLAQVDVAKAAAIGCIGMWLFNNPGGLSFNLIRTVRGTYLVTPTWYAASFRGHDTVALKCGKNQHVTTGMTDVLGDFTCIVWFNNTLGVTDFERLCDKSFTAGFWVGRNGSNANQWGGGVEESNPPYGIYVTLTDGLWHQLVSRRRGTTHHIIGDGGAVSTSNTVSGTATDTTELFLAAKGDDTSKFGGQLGPTFLFNQALSDAVIAENFLNPWHLLLPVSPHMRPLVTSGAAAVPLFRRQATGHAGVRV